MPLTDEQRSMLQLLLGGQSYDDIASLLGTGAADVRARARAALHEMGGADPDAQVAISDYLLGQADPIGRADAVRHLQADPDANALAARLIPQLRLLAPSAELPEIPAPKRGATPTAPPATPSTPAPPPAAPPAAPPTGAQPGPAPGPPGPPSRLGGALSGIAMSERRSQLLVGIGALALLLVVGVLAIAGVFSDDDGGDEEAASAPTDENLTIVQLAPLEGDTGAEGQAVFAQAENQPVLQINLSGLQPAAKGQTYIVWLYNSDQISFPVARDRVGQNGNLTGAAPIPQQIISLVGNQFGCVDVSLASSKATQRALQQAVQGGNLPEHSGESVLRGQIPTQPGEQAASGADSQCEGSAPPAGTGELGGGAGGGAQGGGGN